MKVYKTVTMEMKNVSYTERPRAFLKFERNGFSIEDIIVTRVDACHYDMYASRSFEQALFY